MARFARVLKRLTLAGFLCVLPLTTSVASTLVVCDDVQGPLTLDPHKEFSEKNHCIVQQIFDGLVRFDSRGKIEGALASSWERLGPLRVRFHLREGVFFHNGDPFSAEDVKFSLDRYLNPETGFPARGFLASLDKVEIVDAHTVDITTIFPDGILLNRLAGFVLIVPKKYLQDKGENILSENPVGTGPFRYIETDKDGKIILDANKGYWSAKKAGVDRLVFQYSDSKSRIDRLFDGSVHILTDVPGTMTFKIQNHPNTRVEKIESFFTVMGTFNSGRKPLSDKRVRQAINYAVNREDLVRYDLLGNGRPIAGMALPGTLGYDPTLEPYPYNPERSRRLLKEAGIKLPLHLKTILTEQVQRTASILDKQLQRVGIHLDLKVVPNAEVMARLQAEEWDMGISAFSNGLAHIAFPLSILFYSRSPYSLLHSPEFDGKFEEASGTLDPAEQEKKFQALDRYVYDEALGLPTYQKINIYGVSKRVHFVPYMTGIPQYFETEFIP